MNRNQRNKQLVENLREAIDQALAESSSVLAAMGELEDAGFNPSFCVNIAIPEKIDGPPLPVVTVDQEPILTESDDSFLRRLGITNYP